MDEFDVVLYDDEPGDFSYTVGKTDLTNYYLKFKAKEYEGNGGKWREMDFQSTRNNFNKLVNS
ncbi:hypothetical protein [Bacillus cereus]|uniref:hypothetical protein n=1 Tax=Bacillus cereus TaxID=1396 RepID=UPI0010766408|nr:hypothetical protein [Bacillus cereus]TFZ14310.1 hypothetical protein C6Y54_03170 [Bacillus cereus]